MNGFSKQTRTGQSRKKELAVLSLLTANTHEEAAKQSGVSVSTMYRWARYDGEFQEIMREAKRQAMSNAIGKIQKACTDAVEVLIEVAKNKKAPAMARVVAANSLLDKAFDAMKTEEIVQRLERLEEMANDEHSQNRKAH